MKEICVRIPESGMNDSPLECSEYRLYRTIRISIASILTMCNKFVRILQLNSVENHLFL
jgi:hypothetical protein